MSEKTIAESILDRLGNVSVTEESLFAAMALGKVPPTGAGSSATTSLPIAGPAFTLAMLMESIKRINADKLAEHMRAKGFDPADGALLILPAKLMSRLPHRLPPYVRFSAIAEHIYMVAGPSFFTQPTFPPA